MFLVFQRAMVTLRISAAHGNDLRWRTLALWRIRGVSVLICVCASTRETQEMSGCLRSKLIQRYTKKKETTLQKYFVKQSLYKPDIEVPLLTMMKSCWCRCTLCVRSGIATVELCTKIKSNYELIFYFACVDQTQTRSPEELNQTNTCTCHDVYHRGASWQPKKQAVIEV